MQKGEKALSATLVPHINDSTVRTKNQRSSERGKLENEAESIRRQNVTAITGCSHLLQVIFFISFPFVIASSCTNSNCKFLNMVFFFLRVFDLGIVYYWCRVNRIDFEEVRVDISKRQHLTPEFKGTLNQVAPLLCLSMFMPCLVICESGQKTEAFVVY